MEAARRTGPGGRGLAANGPRGAGLAGTGLVSPYAKKNYVCSLTLDHTSILKLIEEKWNLPPLTRRDAAAQSPLDALDLDGESAFATPPDLPPPTLAWGSWR
jgi:phospholipase C